MNAKQFKQQLLEELYAPYIKCTMCPLGTLGRTNVVFGQGDPDARLMFIGEGPGAREDAQGEPFVGRSGQLLTKTMEKLGLERKEVYITNIVKCRPPSNRAPLPLEIETCTNLLLYNQIKIIRPTVICTLGSIALNALLNKPGRISSVRGTQQKMGTTVTIPTYHPAYILRNPPAYEDFFKDITLAVTLAYSK